MIIFLKKPISYITCCYYLSANYLDILTYKINIISPSLNHTVNIDIWMF